MSSISKALTSSGDKVYVEVHVQPGASRTEISGFHGDSLKIRLKSPPVDGKANENLIEFMAEMASVPKRAVQLVRGQASRKKRIEITGITLEEFRNILQGHLKG